jgi:hypothetical protein
MIERAEFPESINPASDLPIALSIPSQVEVEYSAGGPKIMIWRGVTEFHITGDASKKHLPALIPFFGLIVKAAASNPTLNHKVELFVIETRADSIQGPMALQYGNESPHWGFVVNWWVKERVDGEIVVG